MRLFEKIVAVSLVDESIMIMAKDWSEPLIVPAYVATQTGTNWVLAVGSEAKEMMGCEPHNIQATKVLQNGNPIEKDLATALFLHTIQKMYGRRTFFKIRPTVVMATRGDQPAKAMARDMVLNGGAVEVHLFDLGMATAIGMQLAPQEPDMKAVLTVSEDWFEFSVISLSHSVTRVAGNTGSETFIEDIQNHVSLAREFRPDENAIRSRLMTEGIASAGITNMPGWEVWRGRSEQGRLRAEPISQDDLTVGLAPSLSRIGERIKRAIRTLTPEQQMQLLRNGIRATGSAMRIPGLPKALANYLGYEVIPHESAHHPSIDGARVAISEIKFLRQVAGH